MLSHVRYGFETIGKESFFKLIHKAGLGKIRHVLHDVEVLDWDTPFTKSGLQNVLRNCLAVELQKSGLPKQ